MLRPFFATTLLLIISLLSACGEQPPQLSPLVADKNILAFGDSLTFGTGAALSQSYPAILENLIGIRVINAGNPGEVSAAGVRRLPKVLDQWKPQLLLLCHGGNDLLRKLDEQALEENLGAMIELAAARGIPTLLVATPAPKLFLLRPAPVYERVAKEHAIPLEATALAKVLSKEALRSDAIHPNGAGYRQLAEAIALRLQEAGALTTPLDL